MSISNVPVAGARDAQQAGATLIDVRTSVEFAAGHAAGAINVPLLEPDEDTGQVMPNPDFVRVMKANFAADAALLVSCQSGTRSARASQILETFGFTHITNVLAGFEGWVAAALPTETVARAGHTYADLLTAADNQET